MGAVGKLRALRTSLEYKAGTLLPCPPTQREMLFEKLAGKPADFSVNQRKIKGLKCVRVRKIENRAEIQIFDTESLLEAIAGSQATINGQVVSVEGDEAHINSTGTVLLNEGTNGWQVRVADHVKNLISGRPYGQELDLGSDTYFDRLESAPMGTQTMVIDVFRGGTPGGPYNITVTIDGGTTTYTNVQRGNDENAFHLIYLQSHWGSGVKFTNLKVTKL